MTSKEEDNNALISKIFKMVEEKSEERVVKKKRTRKPMTPEQKAKAVANLKRGRETAMRIRKVKLAAAGKAPKVEPVAPVVKPPTPPPVVKPPSPPPVKPPSPVYTPIVNDGPLRIRTWGGVSLW